MFTHRLAAAATACALSIPTVMIATAPADAASNYFSSCDKLSRVFKHGVAKSNAAAAKQVRDGYGRPSTSKRAKKVYAVNKSRLDRDKDGTACER